MRLLVQKVSLKIHWTYLAKGAHFNQTDKQPFEMCDI